MSILEIVSLFGLALIFSFFGACLEMKTTPKKALLDIYHLMVSYTIRDKEKREEYIAKFEG